MTPKKGMMNFVVQMNKYECIKKKIQVDEQNPFISTYLAGLSQKKKKKKLQFSSKIIVFYVSIRGTENSDA